MPLPVRHLDPEEIRRLYVDEGMTIQQIKNELRTSFATLYREWPPDLPRRKCGDNRLRTVLIRMSMSPEEVHTALQIIMSPEDLARLGEILHG